MMVHNWDTVLVVVKVVDNKTGREHFLEPGAWTQNDRWSKHADMCVQYAQCLKRNLMMDLESKYTKPQNRRLIILLIIYIYRRIKQSTNDIK